MKPAHRPATRTVTVQGEGEYAEWQATAKADFPARLLADLQSGEMGRIIAVLDAIIIDHNLPGEDDALAPSMGDVTPSEGLMNIAAAIFKEIGTLPNR